MGKLFFKNSFRLFLLINLLFLLACSPVDQRVKLSRPSVDIKSWTKKGLYYFRKGRYKAARKYFNMGLKYSPNSCPLNFFNALSYQLEGRAGDVKNLELAAVGYRLAIRFCPHDPWPRYYYGLLEIHLKNYNKAQRLFSSALQRIDNTKNITDFLEAYVVAAYNSGDRNTARELINRLAAISPSNPLVKQLYERLNDLNLPPPQAANRIDKTTIKQTHRRTRSKSKKKKARRAAFDRRNRGKKQVLVDAIIILDREVTRNTRGFNLLNGLQIQYGSSTAPGLLATMQSYTMRQWPDYIKQTTTAGNVFNGSFPATVFSGLLTNVISIPAITYDLNIFNTFDEQDEILARPTLLAEDGKTATYFSGRILILGIQGTLTGTIQKFPIGITMKLKPHFRKDGSLNLDIDIGRDFLVPSTTDTTFQQVAEALSETTKTTVHVHFGETVILSALTEKIQDDESDRTPGLGSIPILKYIFNHRVKEDIQTSVLFLLTPRRYISFEEETKHYTHDRLTDYYNQVVNPESNLDLVFRHIEHLDLYKRPLIVTPHLYNPEVLKAALKDEYKELDTN